jgi:hypothetical protein
MGYVRVVVNKNIGKNGYVYVFDICSNRFVVLAVFLNIRFENKSWFFSHHGNDIRWYVCEI